MLVNLPGNAIKFSPAGSRVRVAAQLATADHSGGDDESTDVQLIVSDDGIGIPPELLANLFEPGKNTTRPGTDDESETGFGMPLVRRFVQAYGGYIEVLSRDRERHPDDSGTEIALRLRSGEGFPPEASRS